MTRLIFFLLLNLHFVVCCLFTYRSYREEHECLPYLYRLIKSQNPAVPVWYQALAVKCGKVLTILTLEYSAY